MNWICVTHKNHVLNWVNLEWNKLNGSTCPHTLNWTEWQLIWAGKQIELNWCLTTLNIEREDHVSSQTSGPTRTYLPNHPTGSCKTQPMQTDIHFLDIALYHAYYQYSSFAWMQKKYR